MPTVYKKKNVESLKRKPRDNLPLEVIHAAYNEVFQCQESGISIGAIAKKYNMPKTTLSRYIKNKKNSVSNSFSSVFVSRQIFTQKKESALCDYLLKAGNMHYGLTMKQTRELAYQYAVANRKTISDPWKNNCCASKDWLVGFLNRNKKLCGVGDFFSKLRDLYERYQFPPSSVYNIDETGVTTVQVPGKTLAEQGKKQIGKMTYGKRGVLVTLYCAINALGNSLPPFFVYPRKKFKDFMLTNAPTGSANISGWMNAEIFLDYIKHFAKYAKPSLESPVLLIFDNHESHISIDVITFAKENGIVLLTLPPHSSNKLQPLDVAVYSPFKRYYNAAVDNWLVNHPGTPITIYQVSQLVSEAYSPAFSKSNIESAFAKTGIFPFKRDIFEESDFLCSAVTDRGVPNDNSILVDEFLETATEKPDEPGPTSNIQPFVSPEYVRPYPKALPRKRKQVGRKPGRTRILTDTPKKTEIAEAWKNQIDKQKKVQIKRNLTDSNIPTSSKKKKIEESESDSEISMSDICEESDDSPFTEEEKEEDSNDRDFEKNDYVLVRFVTETNATVCYIGLVIEKSSQIYKVKFFRRHGISNKFTFPIIDDIQDISGDDTISWNKTCW